MSLYTEIIQSRLDINAFKHQYIQRYTSDEIIQTIKNLMGQSEYKLLSRALGEAGLAIYPNEEEMLAINALMATMDKNWDQVFEWMKPLLEMRGNKNNCHSYIVFVNALLHRLDYEAAWRTVNEALTKFPEDKQLQSLHFSISEYIYYSDNSQLSQ